MQILQTKTYTGAQILIDTLCKLGIECIFGYPGAAVLEVYDELSKTPQIKHYLMRHEQSAVHAAEGYARVSQKCGVVLVTSGPGASNTITGIANAYFDGFPLMVISGQVEGTSNSSFQQLDFVSVAKPCAKKVFPVNSVNDLENTLKSAYITAMSGKKGPVVIDISRDIFRQCVELKNTSLNLCDDLQDKDFQFKEIVKALESAKSPLVVVGGGIVHANACEELRELLKTTGLPSVTTMMAVGVIPHNSKNYYGMIGVYGKEEANKVFEDADTILSLGARFNDRVTSAIKNFESKKLIQINIEAHDFVGGGICVKADLKVFLTSFNKVMQNFNYPHLSYWQKEIQNRNFEHNRNAQTSRLCAVDVIKAISNYTKTLWPIVATEVGQHQVAVVNNFEINEPRKLLTSGGFGAMGFGFPAAIGACVWQDKFPVICITGDGSFQMNLPELAVCMDYNLPVKVFIINNGSLGLVRQLQEEQCEERYFETAISSPDYVKLSQSYGIDAIRVDKHCDIMPALECAFKNKSPFVVEFMTVSDEKV